MQDEPANMGAWPHMALNLIPELGGVPYSGRVYADSLDEAHATEVLTMGLQRLYEDPVGFAKKDPDYFKFILSVLRP